MTGGFLRLFRWRGVPVLVHWSVLVLLAFGLRSGAYRVASLVALGVMVLIHELGHAVLVQHYRLKVREIRIHAFGGECVHEATRSMRQQVVIAWGGVLAQLVLFAAASALQSLHLPLGAELRAMLAVWTSSNLAIAALNLLPFPPLDGHRAWRLKYLLPNRSPKRERRFEGKVTGSLVDDALERARADAEARRRAGRGDHN
jgi:Zn-dependent protease